MAITTTQRPAPRRTDFEAFRAAHPDFVLKLHALRQFRNREFAKLALLSGKAQRNRVRSLLASRPLHLLYAYEGLRRARRLRDATPESVATLAERCTPFHRSREPGVPVILPSRGRTRRVMSYGPEKRMRQLLVADLLRHLHPPLEQQCLFRGGMPAAFRAVADAYHEGFTCAAEIDVIDFYGSVMLAGLADLLHPLPRSVVDHVVWDGGFRAVMTREHRVSVFMEDDHHPSPNAWQGIALGSACSPIVGERILAVLIAAAEPCRVVAYADNMLVLGSSPNDVAECYERMRQRASSEFAGWALGLRSGGIHDLSRETFEFLHHEGRLVSGEFQWSPDQRKLGDFLVAEDDDELADEAITSAEHRVSHWRRAYPEWPDGDEWESRQLAALAARRFYQSATPLNRTRAAEALVHSYLSLGRRVAMEEIAPVGRPSDDTRREQLLDVARARLIRIAERGGWGVEAVACLA